jgi:nucleoside-diphosphate-sugar epimerase
MSIAVIFGGSGFIGCYLAMQVLNDGIAEKVILADIKPTCDDRFLSQLLPYIKAGSIEFAECDVRNDIGNQLAISDNVSFVANLAAIHREPGHEAFEYYETNILGAENVCKWSSEIGCQDIIFTSSIAPYGMAEELKDEASLPVPLTPYGGSKLAAEKIHEGWARLNNENNLTIVRPGVVFGAGEGGNVSRLNKAVLGGYFFYVGNKSTRKAGVYVKELVQAMLWVHSKAKAENAVERSLFNMSMMPAPSVEEYVDVICDVASKKRFIPSIPYTFLLAASYVVDSLSKVLRIDQPINPVRIRKLIKSNSIDPKYLRDQGYEYKYTLLSAFQDWNKQNPEEW